MLMYHANVDVLCSFVLPRYFVDDNWQPKKMDVEVDVPLTLDLEPFRSNGMQVRNHFGVVVVYMSLCRAVLIRWCIVMACCVGAVVVYRDGVLCRCLVVCGDPVLCW